MSTSVRFKSKVAWPFLIAVVSLGYPHAQTKVLRLVPVQSSSTKIDSGTIVETKVLRPMVVSQDCTSRDHMSNETWCNGLQPYGTACQGPEGPIEANNIKKLSSPTIPPISGWGDRYDNGSGPLKCPWFVSTFSRAYVKFDVLHVVTSGPVEGIEFASLSWNTKRLHGKQSNACTKYLYEATGMWVLPNGEKLPSNLPSYTPTEVIVSNLDTDAVNSGYYGVAKQVVKWFEHPDRNWGFVFEPSRNYTEQYSDSQCLESLEDLKLTVKYRVKPTAWPTPKPKRSPLT